MCFAGLPSIWFQSNAVLTYADWATGIVLLAFLGLSFVVAVVVVTMEASDAASKWRSQKDR